MWKICLNEWDERGNLISRKTVSADRVRGQRARIERFLEGREYGVREVSFERGGRDYPSIVQDGLGRKAAPKRTERLRLFEWAGI